MSADSSGPDGPFAATYQLGGTPGSSRLPYIVMVWENAGFEYHLIAAWPAGERVLTIERYIERGEIWRAISAPAWLEPVIDAAADAHHVPRELPL